MSIRPARRWACFSPGDIGGALSLDDERNLSLINWILDVLLDSDLKDISSDMIDCAEEVDILYLGLSKVSYILYVVVRKACKVCSKTRM